VNDVPGVVEFLRPESGRNRHDTVHDSITLELRAHRSSAEGLELRA